MDRNYFISMGPMGYVTEEECQLVVLRGHARFSIATKNARMKDTSFGKELLRQMEVRRGRPKGAARDEPVFDLIYKRCLPLLEKLAPRTSLQELDLESFLHSPTYNLELVKGDDNDGVRIEGENQCQYTPAFFTSPMRTVDLPDSCKEVPQIQACDVCIAPAMNEGRSLDSIQGRVMTAKGDLLYFKPRFDMREPDFEREISILARIDREGLAARLRVPRLHAVVVSGEKAIGMLMTLITSSGIGTHLRSPGLQNRSELHRRWEEQLIGTVQELHHHGIVWGDVHPMNIVIDEAMNAWIIDFGGMNNVAFVDDEKRETIEGDWQGINRIFHDWLPDPQKRSQW